MTHRTPTTWKGAVTVFAGIAALVIVVFASTTGGIVLGLLLIAVAALVAYGLGYRIDRWLREREFFGGDG